MLGLEPVPEQQRGPHMLGVRLPEAARARLLSALTDVNCFAAIRGDALRIAPHLHVTCICELLKSQCFCPQPGTSPPPPQACLESLIGLCVCVFVIHLSN